MKMPLYDAAFAEAQTDVPAPDFIGEVIAILPDGSTAEPEKETIQMRTRINAGARLAGTGKAKIIVESSEAAVRLDENDEIRFIVETADYSHLHHRPLPSRGQQETRLAEASPIRTFGSVKTNESERLRFDAVKYRELLSAAHIDRPTNQPARSESP